MPSKSTTAKPKGLKASKRSAPTSFDPPSSATTPSTSTTTTSSSERTFPLDEDCLTLSDLFELRFSILEILYPYPTALTLDYVDPSKFDEVRSLLRGILHGCQLLEQYVDQFPEEEEEEMREARQERRRQAGREKLQALGLEGTFANGLIVYLQAWSILYLGIIFDEEEVTKPQTVASKLSTGGGGGKKRKIDLNEPRTRLEWFEKAYERSKFAYFKIVQGGSERDGGDVQAVLITSGYVHAKVLYARELIERGKTDEDKERGRKLLVEHESERWLDIGYECGMGLNDSQDEETASYGEAVLADLRSRIETISVMERYPPRDLEPLLKELDSVGRLLELSVDASKGVKESDDFKLWQWLVDVVIAEAKMVSFTLREDAVEAKYRPEAEDGDEDDEDVEVKELPMDAEDIKTAKEASEKAIEALRKTIAEFEKLPKQFAHPSGKDEQYRKLEEVLLVSSALINPSDVEATKAAEVEIEKVRKEGGIVRDGEDNEDEEEEEGGDEE